MTVGKFLEYYENKKFEQIEEELVGINNIFGNLNNYRKYLIAMINKEMEINVTASELIIEDFEGTDGSFDIREFVCSIFLNLQLQIDENLNFSNFLAYCKISKKKGERIKKNNGK
jgi:hypothetical protein